MLYRARNHGEESFGRHCGVGFERQVSYPGDIVEDVDCDDEGGLGIPCLVSRDVVILRGSGEGRGDSQELGSFFPICGTGR